MLCHLFIHPNAALSGRLSSYCFKVLPLVVYNMLLLLYISVGYILTIKYHNCPRVIIFGLQFIILFSSPPKKHHNSCECCNKQRSFKLLKLKHCHNANTSEYIQHICVVVYENKIHWCWPAFQHTHLPTCIHMNLKNRLNIKSGEDWC